VTLVNWAYKHDPTAPSHGSRLEPAENLRVTLSGDVKKVRSIVHGPLPLAREETGGGNVVVPRVDEIDVLVLE